MGVEGPQEVLSTVLHRHASPSTLNRLQRGTVEPSRAPYDRTALTAADKSERYPWKLERVETRVSNNRNYVSITNFAEPPRARAKPEGLACAGRAR